tara:strand:- start:434 stop:601 length:168 start_codon:yes stop_codon:yes gene_type:complete
MPVRGAQIFDHVIDAKRRCADNHGMATPAPRQMHHIVGRRHIAVIAAKGQPEFTQ